MVKSVVDTCMTHIISVHSHFITSAQTNQRKTEDDYEDMIPCTRSPASIICMLLCTMGLVFEVEIHQKGTAKIEESYKSERTRKRVLKSMDTLHKVHLLIMPAYRVM